MKFEKIHNKGQAQLFRNSYMEMLTKTNPLVICGMYLPVMIYFIYLSHFQLELNYTSIFFTFAAGGFFWTFFEYLMHRFAFHAIADSERAQKFIYVLHGNHHHFPRDKERLFMPPVPSIIISSFIFSLFYFLMARNAFMF